MKLKNNKFHFFHVSVSREKQPKCSERVLLQITE